MTPAHQQPKEYIITEDELSIFETFAHEFGKTLREKQLGYIKAIRSRPHPAPAAEFTDAENKWCDDCAAAYNRGFDAGAKTEREQVLPYLEELASPSVSDARKREIIQSLRAPQQGVSGG